MVLRMTFAPKTSVSLTIGALIVMSEFLKKLCRKQLCHKDVLHWQSQAILVFYDVIWCIYLSNMFLMCSFGVF